MAITTVITSVTTADKAPTTAPHTVSTQTGKSTATVRFTPTNSTGHAITCWRIERAGAGVGAGTLIAMAGFPCSDTIPESTCSDTDATRLCTNGLSSASGSFIDQAVAASALGTPDGAKTINVYVGSDDTAIG